MFLWDLWTVILVQILKRIILILQGNDSHKFVVVQSLSRVRLFVIPWTAVRLASLSFSIPEFAQTCICWVGDATIYLILCCPFLLLPSIFPNIRVFSNELALRNSWPKYWSFSLSIRPSNEYSGLISFRIDWFDLLAVQETLKSLLQHHSSKASIFWHSAFFIVQISYPYMTTGKALALTRQTFFGKRCLWFLTCYLGWS